MHLMAMWMNLLPLKIQVLKEPKALVNFRLKRQSIDEF